MVIWLSCGDGLPRDHTVPDTYKGVKEFVVNLFDVVKEVPVLLFPPAKVATAAGGEGSEPEVVHRPPEKK